MAERKYKDSIKERKDLEKIAKEVSVISSADNHDLKMQATQDALSSYHKHEHKIISEHRQSTLNLLEPGKGKEYDTLFKLYKDIDKEHGDHGKLKKATIDEFLGDFADTIIPAMHDMKPKGDEKTKDYSALNMQSLKFYLSQYDQIGGQEIGTTLETIKQLLKEGHGHQASAQIIQAIMRVKKHNEFGTFLDLLIPDDDNHYHFMSEAADKMADEVNKSLKDRGVEDYTVSAKKIGADRNKFIAFFSHYAKKDYAYIEQNAKIKVHKDEVAEARNRDNPQRREAA